MQSYFRIINYGKPYYGLGMVAIFCLILYTIFNTVSLLAIIPFLEILFAEQAIIPPTTPLDWLDPNSIKTHAYFQLYQGIEQLGRQNMLLYFCIFLFGSILIKNTARYLGSYFIAPFEQGIMYALRNKVFGHLLIQDSAFFTMRKKGDLISLSVSDVNVVREAVNGTLLVLIREPLNLMFFLLTLFFISWKLTLFTLIVLPLTALVIGRIRGPLKRKTKEGQVVLGKLVALLDEYLGGINIIKAFQKEQYVKDKYEAENTAYRSFQVSIRRQAELASPLTEVLSVIVVCAIIYFAGTLILDEGAGLKRSEFLGFVAVFSQLLGPIKFYSNALTKVQKGLAAYERIEELFKIAPEISSSPQATLARFDQKLTVEDVSFSYGEEQVLHKITLELPKGKSLALVGPSGSGKSTLAKLVMRMYDPESGSLALDGKNIKELDLESYRSVLGMVDQEAILFHDTVFNNIAFGAGMEVKDKVIEAAKSAFAHEFIMTLPNGYDTLLGERGTRLSGGQRQRISIARALFRNPEILILDEATSNLDTQSEAIVQKALNNLMENRTSIIIAHRLSTVVHADQIIVLKEGSIVQTGTHAELIQQEGLYKDLYAQAES
ncbi:MAG: ABC transporter ATP-binding protein [Bacteroidota bacterium]